MFQWLNYSCKAESTLCRRVLVKKNLLFLFMFWDFLTPPPQLQNKKKDIIPAQHRWFQYYVSIVSDNKLNITFLNICMPINIIVCGKVNLFDLFLNFLFPYRASKAIQMNNLYAIRGKKPHQHCIDTSNVIEYLSNYSFLLIFKLLISKVQFYG